MAGEPYSTIRDLLGPCVGHTLVDVTQHDQEDFRAGGPAEVFLHFSNGVTLHFWIEDQGFEILDGPADDPDDAT